MSCHYTCETEEPTLACSIQAGDVVHVKSLKHNVPVYIVRSLKTKKMGIFPGIHPVFVYKPDYQPQLQPSSALQRIPDMIPPDQKEDNLTSDGSTNFDLSAQQNQEKSSPIEQGSTMSSVFSKKTHLPQYASRDDLFTVSARTSMDEARAIRRGSHADALIDWQEHSKTLPSQSQHSGVSKTVDPTSSFMGRFFGTQKDTPLGLRRDSIHSSRKDGQSASHVYARKKRSRSHTYSGFVRAAFVAASTQRDLNHRLAGKISKGSTTEEVTSTDPNSNFVISSSASSSNTATMSCSRCGSRSSTQKQRPRSRSAAIQFPDIPDVLPFPDISVEYLPQQQTKRALLSPKRRTSSPADCVRMRRDGFLRDSQSIDATELTTQLQSQKNSLYKDENQPPHYPEQSFKSPSSQLNSPTTLHRVHASAPSRSRSRSRSSSCSEGTNSIGSIESSSSLLRAARSRSSSTPCGFWKIGTIISPQCYVRFTTGKSLRTEFELSEGEQVRMLQGRMPVALVGKFTEATPDFLRNQESKEQGAASENVNINSTPLLYIKDIRACGGGQQAERIWKRGLCYQIPTEYVRNCRSDRLVGSIYNLQRHLSNKSESEKYLPTQTNREEFLSKIDNCHGKGRDLVNVPGLTSSRSPPSKDPGFVNRNTTFDFLQSTVDVTFSYVSNAGSHSIRLHPGDILELLDDHYSDL
eukprot:gene3800-8376_t